MTEAENQERLRRAVETGVLETGPLLTIQIDESERQFLLLALAVLVKRSPGFDYAAGELAEKLQGRQMFEDMKRWNSHLDAAPVHQTDVAGANASVPAS